MIHINKILHPTDFSANSNHALKYACAFANHFGAELYLIHVIADLAMLTLPPVDGYLPEGYFQDARRRGQEELAKLPGQDLIGKAPVIRDVLEGAPFTEIIRYAHEHGIDIIVMGTHGYSGLTHMLMGSIAEKVVRKAPCPVLTVQPEGHEFVMP